MNLFVLPSLYLRFAGPRPGEPEVPEPAGGAPLPEPTRESRALVLHRPEP